MTPAEAVARFLVHLETERHASPHTRAAYGRDLATLIAFLEERGARDAEPLAAKLERAVEHAKRVRDEAAE